MGLLFWATHTRFKVVSGSCPSQWGYAGKVFLWVSATLTLLCSGPGRAMAVAEARKFLGKIIISRFLRFVLYHRQKAEAKEGVRRAAVLDTCPPDLWCPPWGLTVHRTLMELLDVGLSGTLCSLLVWMLTIRTGRSRKKHVWFMHS